MALTCAHLQRPKTPTSPPPHLHPPSLPSPHIRRRHLRALDQRRRRRGFGRQLVGRPTSIHARVRAILVEATLGTAAEREKPRPRRPRRAALQAAARARELTRAASRRGGLTARRRVASAPSDDGTDACVTAGERLVLFHINCVSGISSTDTPFASARTSRSACGSHSSRKDAK